MDAITYTHARKNLNATMDKTVANHEPVVITRRNGGAVVLMSLEDFRSWEETANTKNAGRIRAAGRSTQRNQGGGASRPRGTSAE